MLAFNEIATDEQEKQQEANQGNISEICFATMTSGVRAPSGPPSNPMIQNMLTEMLGSKLRYGTQPWGQNSAANRKLLRTSRLALTYAGPDRVSGVSLPFSCPLAAPSGPSLPHEFGLR